jgi:hypothetical protein
MKRVHFAEPGVGACASTVSISRRSSGRPEAGRPPWREELRSAIWGDQRRNAAAQSIACSKRSLPWKSSLATMKLGAPKMPMVIACSTWAASFALVSGRAAPAKI